MTLSLVEEQVVKSRDRVKAYGEVFTPRYMVDQMLDLVAEDLETGAGFVDKTFLEPSAGHGNFLLAILRRKLAAIERRLSADVWRNESLFALASIYGIELLEDNHEDAKANLLAEFVRFHQAHGTPDGRDSDLYRAAAFLIDTNIVRGNTLTAQTSAGEDIQFSWWHRADGKPWVVQREPFTLASLRDDAGFDFTVYATYQPCQIDQVHENGGSDA